MNKSLDNAEAGKRKTGDGTLKEPLTDAAADALRLREEASITAYSHVEGCSSAEDFDDGEGGAATIQKKEKEE